MTVVIINSYCHFDTEQAIDSNNGGIFVNRNYLGKTSVIDRRRNEHKPKMMDHLHTMNLASIIPRKKWLMVGLVMILILVTAIVVPISIYALNGMKSTETKKQGT